MTARHVLAECLLTIARNAGAEAVLCGTHVSILTDAGWVDCSTVSAVRAVVGY